MATYRLLITDLTEYGTLRCVAGWDIDRERMIRPEPGPAAFWLSSQTGQGQAFLPGNIVRLTARKPNPATSYPHFSEDRVVDGNVTVERSLQPQKFKAKLSEIGLCVEDVFNDNVVLAGNSAYIVTGMRCPSLYDRGRRRGHPIPPAKLRWENQAEVLSEHWNTHIEPEC